MLDNFNLWLETLVTSGWALPAVFVMTVIDGVFPPIPSESLIIAVGAVALATGDSSEITRLIIVAALGALCGDVLAYSIGRKVDLARVPFLRGQRGIRVLDWARTAIHRSPTTLIISARYIPVARVAVNITAGAVRLRFRTFILAAAIAGISWAIYSTLIGVLAGAWFRGHPFKAALVGVVAGVLLGMVIDSVVKRISVKRQAAVTANGQN